MSAQRVAGFVQALFGPAKQAEHRGRGAGADLSLRVVPELHLLQPVADVALLPVGELEKPGLLSRPTEPVMVSEADLQEWSLGRTGGPDRPEWHEGAGGLLRAGVSLCRVPDALHMPEYGAVVTPGGAVLHSSVAEALYLSPSLGALPYVSVGGEGPVLRAPADIPVIDRAAVFVAWGGRFNYGHFLLDCLSALAVVQQAGMLEAHHPIAPPMNAWQRSLLHLMLGPGAEVREIAAPLVRVEDLVFASPMDHFLHAPNMPLDGVRERILSSTPAAATGASRLYLSRRGETKRQMVNEEALEAALVARGFRVVRPDELTVPEQVALFRDADVLVSATGAGLANCLFCKPGAKVFELQPSNYTGAWVRSLCHYVGAQWHAYFAPSPIEETDIYIEGALKPGVVFRWQTPLDDFLLFLDERL